MEIATALSVFVDQWFRAPEADRPELIKDLAKVLEPLAPKEPKPAVAPAKKKVEMAKCGGLTAKGKPCSRKVSAEGDKFCKLHLDQENNPPKPKVKKEPKKPKGDKKAPAPEHNHEIGAEPAEPCEVCDHHGDLGAPSDEDYSVSERLDRILDEDNEFEDEE